MKKINQDKRKKNIPLADLSKLIVEAIESEPFLNKEVLVPKIKAILNGFHVNMNIIRFGEIREPSEVDRILMANLALGIDRNFYKHRLHDIVGDEKMKEYHAELNILRSKYDALNSEPNPERSVATDAK